MSYQVLARKWRPRRFQDLVGQQHVLRALINALDNDRLHHAYLFTGTRGVGKTTIARIFAKSLNCERGVSSHPCGECAACRDVDAGRFVDLLEVDAASRTKVEDTRDLLENVVYAPTRGRYKVYLIDEVHMLSTSSFNALLKTLEEPPPHVKFLLATTDPQRLPATVLSRCLQFSLKRMPAELIAGHCRTILEAEGLTYERAALDLLARAADGSMRDGLSLLDQAIAFGGGALTDADVRLMLGTMDRAYVAGVARAIASGEPRKVLQVVTQLTEHAPDYAALLADLLSLWHRVAIAQAVPDLENTDPTEAALIAELAGLVTPEDVQLFYQIGLLARRDLPLAPDARSGFEMALLRMVAFRPEPASETITPASASSASPSHSTSAVRQGSSPPIPSANPVAPAVAPHRTVANEAVMPANVTVTPTPYAVLSPSSVGAVAEESEDLSTRWKKIVSTLSLDGIARQLASNCALVKATDKCWVLQIAQGHAALTSKKVEERLRAALRLHVSPTLQVDIRVSEAAGNTPALAMERASQDRLAAAQQAIQGDDNVRLLLETFNGKIVPNSIQPAESP